MSTSMDHISRAKAIYQHRIRNSGVCLRHLLYSVPTVTSCQLDAYAFQDNETQYTYASHDNGLVQLTNKSTALFHQDGRDTDYHRLPHIPLTRSVVLPILVCWHKKRLNTGLLMLGRTLLSNSKFSRLFPI